MSKPNVLATLLGLPPETVQRARDAFNLTENTGDTILNTDEIIELSVGMDAIICYPTDDFSASTIERLPDSVKCLSTVSVGYEHIDIDACRARGIRVGNAVGALENATADIAWLCLLGAARLAQSTEKCLRSGQWDGFEPNSFVGKELQDKRLGILGMGNIGRVVARRSKGWNMEVHYHNRNRLPADLENGAIYHDTPESLFAVSDYLSINCPSTPQTRGIMNKDTIKLLPKGAIVSNTSRGVMVNDDALIEALQSGHLFAAGLDVFNNEPDIDKRYFDLDNVFILPHIGGATDQARSDTGKIVIENVLTALAGAKMPSELT